MLKSNYLNLKYWNIFTIIAVICFILFLNEGIYYACILLLPLEVIYLIMSFINYNYLIINFDENSLFYHTFFSKRILKFDEINYYKNSLFSYKVYSIENKKIFKINKLYTSYFKLDKFTFDEILKNKNINQYKEILTKIYNKKFSQNLNLVLFRTINILLLIFDSMVIYILDCWILYGSNYILYFFLLILFLFLFLLLIYKFFGNEKTLNTYYILSFLLFFPIFILNIFSFSYTGPSITSNFKNYLKFDKEIKNRYSEQLNTFFPKNINKDEVIKYYYFYEHEWDLNFEIYLEIKVEDSKFNNLIIEYMNNNTYYMLDAYYNDSYIELIKNDNISFDNINKNYTSFAFVEKLIYNEDTNIIIYEYLHVEDPFDFEEIYYFNRFNINAYEYNSYVNGEKNI